MFWIKRFFCGLVALVFIVFGAMLLNSPLTSRLIISGFLLIGGASLAHIAIKQTLPSYSFWITIIAIGLAYALFSSKMQKTSEGDTVTKMQYVKDEPAPSTPSETVKQTPKQVNKQRKSTGFDLSAYPRISGSATIIHAHVFYIGGRYVRLFGVDAPDNDQICSSASGSSYNCGEEAASWMRNWIDQNEIDCYLLKVNPQGQDLATCVWGQYDIGAGLVGSGWGIAKTKESHIYEPYQAKAQSLSSGLWQGSFYNPEDWRDIKRSRNNFKIQRRRPSKKNDLFGFGSWFK